MVYQYLSSWPTRAARDRLGSLGVDTVLLDKVRAPEFDYDWKELCMATRRRRDGLPEMLQEIFLYLPWWVGPPVAGVVFVAAKLLGGALNSDKSPLGGAMGALISGLAPYLAVFVLVIWAIALCQKVYRRRLLASQAGIESIRALSWRDFEVLVGEALRRDGYAVDERVGVGADGGVDLVARRGGETMFVQCKHWKTWDVGVRVVREVYGVMTADRATSAMIVTTGRFSRPARAFAEGKPLRLMDGEELASFVGSVQRAGRISDQASRSAPEAGPQDTGKEVADATLPSCPMCGAPMAVRMARKGKNIGQQFLGCSMYPKCKGTRELAG